MKRLARCAPTTQIDLRRISEATAGLLESGEADLAIGFIPPMGAGFCQQRLFKERFVCAVRRDHPRIDNSLSLEEFEREMHLAISTTGTGHNIVERSFEAKGVHRKIALTVPSFLGITSVITSLNYIVTLPEQLANHLARSANIKVLPLPVNFAPYYILQHWHERYTHDPASRWLRSTISELFSSARNVDSSNVTEMVTLPAPREAGLRPRL
jgi:DNA-binding transcriptional LysR family regulator